jgi:hypothetical protein
MYVGTYISTTNNLSLLCVPHTMFCIVLILSIGFLLYAFIFKIRCNLPFKSFAQLQSKCPPLLKFWIQKLNVRTNTRQAWSGLELQFMFSVIHFSKDEKLLPFEGKYFFRKCRPLKNVSYSNLMPLINKK